MSTPRQYAGDRLDVTLVDPDPMAQFRAWFAAASALGLPQVNAMTLATADATGAPSARIVLLKDADAQGFVFFTNYESRKGDDLAANPRAALVFYWEPMDRQVRIEGTVAQLPAAESDAYFTSRPRGSQLGAIASPQSRPLPDRATLDDKVAELDRTLAQPTRPAYWGGFRVTPTRVEFWQGQPSRLHDRVLYVRNPDSTWSRTRLAP